MLHERRPAHLPDYGVTHPSSGERLQALAAVVESNPAYKRLVPEMDEALRAIRVALPDGSVAAGAATATVSTYSDTEAAYVELLVAADADDEFDPKNGVPISARVLYHGVRGTDGPHAVADVLCKLRRGNVGESDYAIYYEPDESGGVMARVRPVYEQFQARIAVPPGWRDAWPDGLLRVAEVRRADRSVERPDWGDLGEDPAPMTSLIAAVDEGRAGAREVSAWVQWCLEQGREADAILLNARAVATSPVTAGYASVIAEIDRLASMEIFEDAAAIAQRFRTDAGRSRPGLYQICGIAALDRGDHAEAFENAFLELHAFRPDTEFAESATVLMQQVLDAMDDDGSGNRDGTRFRTFVRLYNERPRIQLKRGRVTRLREALAQLDGMSADVQNMVAVLQLRAEVRRDIGRLTADEASLRESARLLRTVLEGEPGFAPAWVQLAHALLDLHERAEAEACLARAEELAPSSPQLHDLQGRFLRDGR